MARDSGVVSVIIPCYNHGRYLHEAINSILDQTYQEYEIIVINDGSDDQETIEILNNLTIPNCRVLHKENGDVASARNYGIQISKGEYILTLDADDKYAPSFIEKAVNILNTQLGVGMVTSYHKRWDERNGIRAEVRSEGGELVDFLKKNQAVACLMYRYQCWEDAGGYDENIPGYEDWEFSIGVTKHGWKVHSIPEYLFFYRKVDDSMFVRVNKNRPDIIKYIVRKHRDQFQKHVEEIIYSREVLIKSLREDVDMFKNSNTVKVGNALLSPLKMLSGKIK